MILQYDSRPKYMPTVACFVSPTLVRKYRLSSQTTYLQYKKSVFLGVYLDCVLINSFDIATEKKLRLWYEYYDNLYTNNYA